MINKEDVTSIIQVSLDLFLGATNHIVFYGRSSFSPSTTMCRETDFSWFYFSFFDQTQPWISGDGIGLLSQESRYLVAPVFPLWAQGLERGYNFSGRTPGKASLLPQRRANSYSACLPAQSQLLSAGQCSSLGLCYICLHRESYCLHQSRC